MGALWGEEARTPRRQQSAPQLHHEALTLTPTLTRNLTLALTLTLTLALTVTVTLT